MTVWLDASALVAYLRAEPGGPHVRDLVESGPTAVTAINYGEVVDTVSRLARTSPTGVRRQIESLASNGLRIASVPPDQAADAATLRVRHYRSRSLPVSLADCIAIVAARGKTLATADRDQATVAREEGVDVIELPPSDAQ